MTRLPFPRSIRLRLALAFGTLILLLGMVALDDLVLIRRLAAENARLVRQDVQHLVAVQRMHALAEGSARELLVLLTAERTQRVQAYGRIDRSQRDIDATLAELRPVMDAPALADRLRIVTLCRDVYKKAYLETVDLIEYDQDAAKRVFARQTQKSLDDFVTATAGLAEAQLQQMQHRQQVSADMIDAEQRKITWLAGLAMLLAGLVAIGVTRSITRPLASTAALAWRISKGDYSEKLDERGGHEIARVGKAMNAMMAGIAEREQTIRQLAYHDPLTGLANRTRLLESGQALLQARHRMLALLHIDLRRLKSINEVLGFGFGDAALTETARRITRLAGHDGLVARLSGGSFAILTPVPDAQAVSALMNGLNDAARLPAHVEGHRIDLATVIGAAIWPDHGEDMQALLRHAEIALYAAKRTQQPHALYAPGDEASRISQLGLLSELDTAIRENQLRLYVQPKCDLASGQVLSAEALVRWQHPERGFIPPSEFIPFAESAGEIGRITSWLLERTTQLLERMQAHAGPPVRVAVNLSSLDIQDMSLAPRIARLLSAHGLAPDRLGVEITESGVMQDTGKALGVMHALHDMGICLSIDDFGTGYASLAYLRQMPVSELKIDRSFVTGIDRHPDARRLIGAIIHMGHTMHLRVTAEGVETAEETAILGELGCDTVQGYHFARPMPEDAFLDWLQDNGGPASHS